MATEQPLPGLAGLDADTVDRLLSVGRLVHIPDGWTPMRANEPADEAYLLLEGEARVVADDIPLADLGPGSFIGEMGLIDHTLRSARVTVTTPVLALAWPGEDFQSLREELPTFDQLVRRVADTRTEENEQA